MIKVKSVVVAHKAQMNPNIGGVIDIFGSFDNLIQPVFPFPMMNMSIVLTFEGVDRPVVFEARLNGPSDDLITKGEFGVLVDPFGVGKKIIDLEKFLVKDRGLYTIDIFEKFENGSVKFIETRPLFIADYPPQRPLTEEIVEEILKTDNVIKSVKTDFRPLGAERAIQLQYNLNENDPIDTGYIAVPKDDKLIIDGKEYDTTGIRRQIEWMFGNPIPEQAEEEVTTEEEVVENIQ
jgi:hypothetical protein